MAGSYNHAVYSDGTLKDNKDFVGSIENLGDAYEMAEEMYGMIWLMANGDPLRVEAARRNYKVGIFLAPGDQKAQF